MERTCLKCGHLNPAADGGYLEACPKCGAIYSKVERAMAERQTAGGAGPAHAAAVAQPEPARAKRADEKFCSECAAIINAKAEICPKCGVRQLAPPQPSPFGHTNASSRNKVVAGALALLLGGLGAHKFYLGKGVQGILYLVFCWTFIPALLGLIEGLNYLFMSEKTFFERYGT